MLTTSTGSCLTIATTSDSSRRSRPDSALRTERCTVGRTAGLFRARVSDAIRSCISSRSQRSAASDRSPCTTARSKIVEAIEVMELDARGQVRRAAAITGDPGQRRAITPAHAVSNDTPHAHEPLVRVDITFQ